MIELKFEIRSRTNLFYKTTKEIVVREKGRIQVIAKPYFTI